MVDSGVLNDGDKWLVAWDQRSAGVGAPPMEKLLQAASGEVVLAAGEHDHMVAREQLTRLHSKVEIIPDRGHNVHVEDPRAVWELIARHVL